MNTRELFNLEGQVALVTGGSRGLGLQIAEGLGDMGCRVAITARKADELAQAKQRLSARGIEVVAIANDLAKVDGIPAICPGFFPTKMASGILERMGERVVQGTPLRRLGGDEDLKGVAVFLASNAARHITGQCIAVDGGQSSS